MSRLITLEDMLEESSHHRVVHIRGGLGLEKIDSCSTKRGLLGRCVPIRSLDGVDTWRPSVVWRRLRLAWGVFVGRYDAFSWDLADDPECQLYKDARRRVKPDPTARVHVIIPIKD